MKRLLNITFFTLLIVVGAGNAFAQDASGVFMIVKGDVKVTAKANGQTEAAKVGRKVFEGDTITSGADSRAKIVMSDKNVLNVLPDSKMVLSKYQNNAAKDERNVELKVEYGKVRAAVEQKYDGEKNKFNIKTPTAVAGVRGTDFMAGFNQQTKETAVVTFSGSVAFGTAGPNGEIQKPVFVNQGEASKSAAGKSPEPPKPMPKEELQKMNQETSADNSSGKKNDGQKEASKEEKKEDKKDDKKDDKKEDSKDEKKDASKEDKKDDKKDDKKEEKKEASKDDKKEDKKDSSKEEKKDASKDDKKEEKKEAKKEDSKKEEPKKDEAKKEDVKKEEPKKEQAKEEAKKQEPARQDAKSDEGNKPSSNSSGSDKPAPASASASTDKPAANSPGASETSRSPASLPSPGGSMISAGDLGPGLSKEIRVNPTVTAPNIPIIPTTATSNPGTTNTAIPNTNLINETVRQVLDKAKVKVIIVPQ